jgi:very-short-patch-repair endonuclease
MIDPKNRENNNIALKNVRQKLRNKMPAPEVVFWHRIQNKQINDLKFRRQYSIGNFVIDFYCVKSKLAIEIDGESHYSEESIENDKVRDLFLRSKGITVLRFTNDEIMRNIDGVLSAVQECHTATNPS